MIQDSIENALDSKQNNSVKKSDLGGASDVYGSTIPDEFGQRSSLLATPYQRSFMVNRFTHRGLYWKDCDAGEMVQF